MSSQYWTQLVTRKPELVRKVTPRLTGYIKAVPTEVQTAFLCLDEIREVLYGGAGGGGKSWALLMGALQYVDCPGYKAILMRRTYPELEMPDGLIEWADAWLSNTDAKWLGYRRRWAFPSGAVLQFGHMQTLKDRRRYSGSAFHYIGMDELTRFLEIQYLFMFSRLRKRMTDNIPMRMRGGTNPGDEGHDWVKRRFISEHDAPDRMYIPAKLADNHDDKGQPYLDAKDYEAGLMHLDAPSRLQIMLGSWEVVEGAGSVFKAEWFKIVEELPSSCTQFVRYWDLAATVPNIKNQDPDWTAGVLGTIDPVTKNYYIVDVVRFRGAPGTVKGTMLQTAEMDRQALAEHGERAEGQIQYRIYWEEEGGSSAKEASETYTKLLAGFEAFPDHKESRQSKNVRAGPVSSQAQAGNVYLISGSWNRAFIDEHNMFPIGAHDDQVDGDSGCYAMLNGKVTKGAGLAEYIRRQAEKQKQRRAAEQAN